MEIHNQSPIEGNNNVINNYIGVKPKGVKKTELIEHLLEINKALSQSYIMVVAQNTALQQQIEELLEERKEDQQIRHELAGEVKSLLTANIGGGVENEALNLYRSVSFKS